GLPAEKFVCEQYQDVLRLDESLIDLVADRKLPFRGAQALLKFQSGDQREFAHSVASRLTLTSNQLLQVAEWLLDLLKSTRQDLRTFLVKNQLLSILDDPQGDGRQRADRFLSAVYALRFPRLWGYKQKFKASSQEVLKNIEGLKLEAPEPFEQEGFVLQAQIRRRDDLDRILEMLARKKRSLNSLFDIML
ncbi:MAG: hypothetical protein NC930_04970, partial [Candidatus Omnitrophica bacterium]|nr:hypothetical protein [Candidatus Omnitrophota bacterium]